MTRIPVLEHNSQSINQSSLPAGGIGNRDHLVIDLVFSPSDACLVSLTSQTNPAMGCP